MNGARLFAGVAAFLLLLPAVGGQQKGLELEFWHGIEAPENVEVLEELVSEFEKQSGIRIKLVNYGAQDQAMPRLMAALQANRPPDMLWFNPTLTGMLSSSEMLLPAGDMLMEMIDESDVYQALWEAGSYNGKIYGVPFDANNLGIYYNKELFIEAGLDPEEYEGVSLSWSEFIDLAETLTEGSTYGFLVPFGRLEWTVWIWEIFLWSAGGELLEGDLVKFADKPGVEALQYWVDLIYKHNVAKLSETNAGYKLDDFFAGRVAMTVNGPWNYPILKDNDWLDNTGVMLMPHKDKVVTNIGGEHLYIFKTGSERENASLEFAEFVLSPEFQTEWAIKTGYLPVCKSALESSEYQSFLDNNPFMKTFAENMEYGKVRPSAPIYTDLSTELGSAIEAALLKQKDPEEALKDAKEKVESLL